MKNINKNYFDIGYMDTLSFGSSILHRIDPRIKLITTLLFIIFVVSFDKYTISALIPFFIYPVTLISLSNLPFMFFIKKILIVSPFAVLIGIFNPFIDREIIFQIGSFGLSGGILSFISILMRFLLTVSSVLILIASTGFNSVCLSLEKLRIPQPFVVQLLLFYRYIFVLLDETQRMMRARSLRTFNNKHLNYHSFISLLEQLLIRTLDRAERIYIAMCSRGFDGHISTLTSMRINNDDLIFFILWLIIFISFKFFNITILLGLIFNTGNL